MNPMWINTLALVLVAALGGLLVEVLKPYVRGSDRTQWCPVRVDRGRYRRPGDSAGNQSLNSGPGDRLI